MNITADRILFVDKHFTDFQYFNEENDDEKLPDYDLFLTLNAVEQYYLAESHNWDNLQNVLDWIIDSPICDKGTASMIFWLAQPDWYLSQPVEEIPDYEMPVYHLLQKIIRKFEQNEFKTEVLEFDPSNEVKNLSQGVKLPEGLLHAVGK